MPAILYSVPGELGRVKVLDRSLGKVSVVQMARAADIQAAWSSPSPEYAAGIPFKIFSIGSLVVAVGQR